MWYIGPKHITGTRQSIIFLLVVLSSRAARSAQFFCRLVLFDREQLLQVFFRNEELSSCDLGMCFRAGPQNMKAFKFDLFLSLGVYVGQSWMSRWWTRQFHLGPRRGGGKKLSVTKIPAEYLDSEWLELPSIFGGQWTL